MGWHARSRPILKWLSSPASSSSGSGDSIGLTTAQFAVLNVVGGREATIQQLSSDMGTDLSAMVKLIKGLEEAGLVERRRRPNDRRAWEVAITAKGQHTLVRARRLASQVEETVLGGLTANDGRSRDGEDGRFVADSARTTSTCVSSVVSNQ